MTNRNNSKSRLRLICIITSVGIVLVFLLEVTRHTWKRFSKNYSMDIRAHLLPVKTSIVTSWMQDTVNRAPWISLTEHNVNVNHIFTLVYQLTYINCIEKASPLSCHMLQSCANLIP